MYDLDNTIALLIHIITSSSFSSVILFFILTTINYQYMLSGRKFWNKLKFQENCAFITKRSYLPWVMSAAAPGPSNLTVWCHVDQCQQSLGHSGLRDTWGPSPFLMIHWTAKNSFPRCSPMQYPQGLREITRGINISSFLMTLIRNKGVREAFCWSE